jgi:branched-chain amino acid transport system substrate-binding protein
MVDAAVHNGVLKMRMQKRYSKLIGLISLLICNAITAQSTNGGTAPSPSSAAVPIKIGWFGPLTGESAPWGQPELNTLKMMTEDYNAGGGIEIAGVKHTLEIIAYDDMGRSSNAIRLAKKLASKDHVVAIVGPQGSGEAMPIGSTLEAAKVPCVATTATNPLVTVTSDGKVKPYVFRACFNDNYQGKAAAHYAYSKLTKRTAAILMEIDDPYSEVLSRSFKENYEKIGGKVLIETSFRTGNKDFKSILNKVKSAEPEIVFMPIYYMDVVPLAKQARELGLDKVFLGCDGWPNNDLVKSTGSTLDGCFYINHIDVNSRNTKPFQDKYMEKYHVAAELNSLLAHDAFAMVIDAIQRAKSIKGEDIQAALETTDIQGLSGRLKMGPNHDPIMKQAWIMRISGSELVLQDAYTINE